MRLYIYSRAGDDRADAYLSLPEAVPSKLLPLLLTDITPHGSLNLCRSVVLCTQPASLTIKLYTGKTSRAYSIKIKVVEYQQLAGCSCLEGKPQSLNCARLRK